MAAAIARAIALEAWRCAPHECCGFCSSGQIFPAPNQHPQPGFHYAIDPALWLKVPPGVAVYHSHPGASHRPSEVDHRQAWDGLVYLIYGLKTRRLQAYRAKGGRLEPEPLAIVDQIGHNGAGSDPW